MAIDVRCPKCSDDFEAESITLEPNTSTYELTCWNCGAEFRLRIEFIDGGFPRELAELYATSNVR